MAYEIRLTDKAAQVVREAFAAENVDPAQSYLRVGAHPGGCSGYKFDMDYADATQVSDADEVFESNGVKVAVSREMLNDVLGSLEIDFQTGNMVERGFKFRQVLEGGMCGCGESFTPIKQRKA
ncbi:MAG TPA: iron-sulfur cluster assembly accessory protein [bacterium]|nr:iron-sulfur cluster assembly accessory protein [bacterium]HKJ92403.1 iron-sulfur cluster assembly accessory protein [Longimicrobiales bacterium]